MPQIGVHVDIQNICRTEVTEAEPASKWQQIYFIKNKTVTVRNVA